MAAHPYLTQREWRRIEAILPATGGVGRRRRGDREALAVLFLQQALDATRFVKQPLQGLVGRKAAALLVVKRARWREDDTWQRLLAAGTPAIERMRTRELRRDGNSGMAKLMQPYERARA